jgi:flagellar basal-body rod modification protein FlgD
MNSEEFAVQLAQFSQVEQLIEINKKLDSGLGGAESVASMASYLGTEVALGDSQLSVSGGQGSNLFVNIPGGTQSLRVDLKDETGQVVAQHAVPEFAYGPQTIALNGLDAADGKYDVRVVSVDQSGKFTDLDAKVTGTVEGFVLEPEPKLLVGGEEVSLENVSAVYKGAS